MTVLRQHNACCLAKLVTTDAFSFSVSLLASEAVEGRAARATSVQPTA